jgi:glycosyltransferase involved in cell wall biosynthesis
MRIVVFHQHFLAPGQGGGSRFNELSKFWSEAGHEVIVVAGSVNHSGNTGSAIRPWRLYCEERGDGNVAVWRCWVPDTYAGNYLQRALAFLGYMFSAAWASLFLPRPDVIIATSPPLIAVMPAWFASKVRGRGCPWVFEIRDLWPESAITTGVIGANSIIARALYAMERFAAGRSTAINVLTPAFREDLERRGLAARDKIVMIPNGADVQSFRPTGSDDGLRAELGWGDRNVVLYAGAHGRANALDQLVGAAEALRHRSDIVIACVGDGPERERLARDAASRGLTNILFHGSQPKCRMPAIVNSATIGTAVLQDNPTFRTVYPNKVFDYMACAKPVLLAIDGVARQLVCTEADAGMFVKPENPSDLAARIEELVDNPAEQQRLGRNGLRWVRANASREQLAARYLDILIELTGSESTAASAARVVHQ